jgi:hypothetical protein
MDLGILEWHQFPIHPDFADFLHKGVEMSSHFKIIPSGQLAKIP